MIPSIDGADGTDGADGADGAGQDPAAQSASETAAGRAAGWGADPCPCGRGESYASCCGAIHAGVPAPTAERLMRARYSAFVVGDTAFLLASWHPGTRPVAAEFALEPDTKWLRLLIDSATLGGPFDQTGTVTFAAIGRTAEGRFEQREHSRFLRGGGTGWQYVDGDSLGLARG